MTTPTTTSEALFDRVDRERGRIDLLVNNVWGGYEGYVGRAVAALAADPDVVERSGGVFETGALAREYGFTDVDGTRPPPYEIDAPRL